MKYILPEIVSVGIFNTQKVSSKSLTKKRTTTMFEIEIPVEKGGMSYINSQTAPIETTLVICAKPGETRQTMLPFKCYYIHFILKDGDLYERLMDIPDFIKPDNPDKYRNVFEKMYKYFESPVEDDEIILNSLVLELIYMLTKDSEKLHKREQIKVNNYITIERAIKYIKENLTADLSLENVSQFAGMSPIHFHNCFKTATAYTLHRYVEEQRIKKAANMLLTTDYSLTRIAYECGFSSQSYFSFAFKRKMKATPRQYAINIFNKYTE